MKKFREQKALVNIHERNSQVLKKLFLMTKITVFCFFLSIIQVMAVDSYAQMTRMSLKVENERLENVFSKIEKESEFFFLYNKDLIDVEQKVSVNAQNETIKDILDVVLSGKDIAFTVFNRQIVLSNIDMINEMVAQQNPVSGTVTDESGLPLPGVTVVVKGTTQGTVTNEVGKYSLINIPENTTLVFSFVGMLTQEVEVENQNSVNVTMVVDAIGIEEVVAIGYGTRKKETLTGSVAKIEGETIKKNPAPNISGSLGGKIPGLVSINYSGQPGEDGNKLLIRGLGTLGDSSPLIIIDGVEAGNIDRIDPTDIESISILKDASAAIYGVKAANGVIIVTTKTGEKGKPTIEYGYNLGLGQPTFKPEIANAYEYNKYVNAYYVANNEADKQLSDSDLEKLKTGSDPDNYFSNTDWWDEVVRKTAPIQRHTASIRGGTDDIKYFASIGYLDQESVFLNGADAFVQKNYRSNFDWKITDAIKVGLKLSGRMDEKTGPNTPMRDIWWMVQAINPRFPVYFSNGLPWEGKEDGWNPALMVSDAGGTSISKSNTYTNILTYEVQIPWVKGLFVDGWYSIENGNSNYRRQQYPWTVYGRDSEDNFYPTISKRLAQKNLNERANWFTSNTLNAKLNYSFDFGKHSVNAFVAYEQNEFESKWISAFRTDLISIDKDAQLFMGSQNGQGADGSAYKIARQNYISRVSYNFDDKYLVDFTFRRDGSPIFPENKRFGNFPGLSAAWRISEESLIKDKAPYLSNLKLRASWGQLGNDRVAEYQYLTAYNYSDAQVIMGEEHNVLAAFYPGVNANPYITWEVAENANIGIDASFMDRLIELEFDVFKNTRKNILITRSASIPDYVGLVLPDENLGKMNNQGFEMVLSHSKKIRDFTYTISGNYSYNYNEVVDIDETPNVLEWQKRTGKPFGAELYYETDGLYSQADIDNANLPKYGGAQAGDIKVVDYNADGVIDGNDRVRMEKSVDVPRIMYGFSVNTAYKRFDLNMIFQGAENVYRYLYTADIGIRGNFLKEFYTDFWTTENQNAPWPKANPNTFGSTQANDFFLLPAGYLRLSSMDFGYTLPKSVVNTLTLQSVRFYFSGSNLFLVYNKLKYFDPEMAENRGYYYPRQRIFNFGVNVTF